MVGNGGMAGGLGGVLITDAAAGFGMSDSFGQQGQLPNKATPIVFCELRNRRPRGNGEMKVLVPEIPGHHRRMA